MRPLPRPRRTRPTNRCSANTCSPNRRRIGYAARHERGPMTMTLNRVVTEDQIRGYYTRAEGGDLTFTAVTSGVKRDGLDLDVAGLSTDNFMRNPVVLWVHDYAGQVLPIGRVTSL